MIIPYRLGALTVVLLLVVSSAQQGGSGPPNGTNGGGPNPGNDNSTNSTFPVNTTSGNETSSSDGSDFDPVQLGIVLGAVFGGMIGVIGLIYFIWICWPRCVKMYQSRKKSRRSEIRLTNMITKVHSDVSQEDFQAQFSAFLKILGEVREKKKKFTFKQKYLNREIDLVSITSSKLSPYRYKLIIAGQDYIGGWKGEGLFMMTEVGACFWMQKKYAKKENRDIDLMIFESKLISENECEGRWCYEGEEDEMGRSGTWKISTVMVLDDDSEIHIDLAVE